MPKPTDESYYKIYLFVRTDLKMRKGKSIGQGSHAAARLARMVTQEQWDEYLKFEVKYVYKISGKFPDFEKLVHDAREIDETVVYYQTIVVDEGLTQIKPKTATVMGVFTDLDLNPQNKIFKLMS